MANDESDFLTLKAVSLAEELAYQQSFINLLIARKTYKVNGIKLYSPLLETLEHLMYTFNKDPITLYAQWKGRIKQLWHILNWFEFLVPSVVPLWHSNIDIDGSLHNELLMSQVHYTVQGNTTSG